jgi:hypothetical protein
MRENSTARVNQLKPARPSSGFVTMLAWAFIGLAGLGMFTSILQNVMITLFFPAEIETALNVAKESAPVPETALFLFENLRLIFGSFLVISTATLVAAIGLLRRKNWARRLFIGVMVLGILWNFGGFWMQAKVFSSLLPLVENAPSEFQDLFRTMTAVITTFSVFMAFVFSALFGWIIRKLMSEPVRAEFEAD